MRMKWWWVTMGLIGCGGTSGAITGEPVSTLTSVTSSSVTSSSVTSGDTVPGTPSAAEVEMAFHRLMSVRLECGRRPGSCPVDELAVAGSSIHGELFDLMNMRAEAGITASSRGSLRYRVDDVRVDGDAATIDACLTDDTVMVMDGAIFDESTLSATVQWAMSLTETGWKWSTWRFISVTREGDLCAFTE